MAITKGTRVAGHINNSAGRTDFTGIVTDTFTEDTHGEARAGVIVQCHDGHQRTVRLENVQPITINMAHALEIIRAEGGTARYGLRNFGRLNINAHSVSALLRRGLLTERREDGRAYVDLATG